MLMIKRVEYEDQLDPNEISHTFNKNTLFFFTNFKRIAMLVSDVILMLITLHINSISGSYIPEEYSQFAHLKNYLVHRSFYWWLILFLVANFGQYLSAA